VLPASAEYIDFRDRVWEAAIRDRHRQGKQRFADLGASALGVIEGRLVMRREAATKCKQLLDDARQELRTQQMGPPAEGGRSS
jgi:hypothetical protein